MVRNAHPTKMQKPICLEMRVENIILLILIFCLVICILFWRQLSQFNKPPGVEVTRRVAPTPPQEEGVTSGKEIDALMITGEMLRGRDVFKLPWQEVDKVDVPISSVKLNPILSTICWNEKIPLAIIDGEILAKGDSDAKSQFRVESIMSDKVKVKFLDSGKDVWLLPGAER